MFVLCVCVCIGPDMTHIDYGEGPKQVWTQLYPTVKDLMKLAGVERERERMERGRGREAASGCIFDYSVERKRDIRSEEV